MSPEPETTYVEINQGLLMKRRKLIEKVLLGSAAFAALVPILALIKSPAPIGVETQGVKTQQGRTCIDILSLKNISYKGNELIIGEIAVKHNENEYKFGLYTLRGDFPDALAPTVVIDRKEQRVFAYATDLEWFLYNTMKKDDIEILNEVIEIANKDNKKGVVRYVKIMRDALTQTQDRRPET
jgi:hypothetical protein